MKKNRRSKKTVVISTIVIFSMVAVCILSIRALTAGRADDAAKPALVKDQKDLENTGSTKLLSIMDEAEVQFVYADETVSGNAEAAVSRQEGPVVLAPSDAPEQEAQAVVQEEPAVQKPVLVGNLVVVDNIIESAEHTETAMMAADTKPQQKTLTTVVPQQEKAQEQAAVNPVDNQINGAYMLSVGGRQDDAQAQQEIREEVQDVQEQAAPEVQEPVVEVSQAAQDVKEAEAADDAEPEVAEPEISEPEVSEKIGFAESFVAEDNAGGMGDGQIPEVQEDEEPEPVQPEPEKVEDPQVDEDAEADDAAQDPEENQDDLDLIPDLDIAGGETPASATAPQDEEKTNDGQDDADVQDDQDNGDDADVSDDSDDAAQEGQAAGSSQDDADDQSEDGDDYLQKTNDGAEKSVEETGDDQDDEDTAYEEKDDYIPATEIDYEPVSYNAAVGNEIVSRAASLVGNLDYVWGENSLETGTDCSGFTHLLYEEQGIYVPRGSDDYQDMANINYEDLMPGDIVVYRNGGHVAIYAGNDTVIHCSNEEEGTKVSSMWYDQPTAYVRAAQ